MAKSFLTSHRAGPIAGQPPIFRSDADALAWSVKVGAYRDTHQARVDFAAMAQRGADRWAYWIGLVARKMAGQQ